MAKKKTKKKSTVASIEPKTSKTAHKTSKPAWEKDLTGEDWNIVMLVVAAVLILGIFAGVANLYSTMKGQVETVTLKEADSFGIPPGEVSQKAIEFIRSEMVPPGVDVQIIDITEESGMYKLQLLLNFEGEAIEAESYATKDGKMFFVSGYDMEPQMPQPVAASVFDAPNTEKPAIKFFVMSFCPYGMQAEEGLEPVYRLLKDKVDWQPHYIIYENYRGGDPDYCIDDGRLCSMFGIRDLMENVRKVCVYNNYGQDTWWDYVKYVYSTCSINNIESCWREAADYAGVDASLVESCAEANAVEYMSEELEISQNYGASGSPTIFINDALYSGGRAPENFKNAICSGFLNQPDECGQTISEEAIVASGSC